MGRFFLFNVHCYFWGKAGLSAVTSSVCDILYIGNVSTLSTPRCGHFVFVYADDIIFLAPSVTELGRL